MKIFSVERFVKESGPEYSFDVEAAKLDFAIELNKLLKLQGLSKKMLAEKLQVSPAMVTKMLRGDSNLTIETMVKAVRSANGKLHINIAMDGFEGRWFSIVKSDRMSVSNRVSYFCDKGRGSVTPWEVSVENYETKSHTA